MTEDELMQLIIKADPRPDLPALYTISGANYRHFERFAALLEEAIRAPAQGERFAALLEEAIRAPAQGKPAPFVDYAIERSIPIPEEHMAKWWKAENAKLRAEVERLKSERLDEVFAEMGKVLVEWRKANEARGER